MTTVKIQVSSCSESPREWDNLATICGYHKRYNICDENFQETILEDIRKSPKYRKSWEDIDLKDPREFEALIEKSGVAGVLVPLYMYEHGNVALSLTQFSCPWDSGQLGFVYISKETLRNEYSCKRITQKVIDKALSVVEGELKTYQHYINGDVYSLEVTNADNEVVFDENGFYGSDVEKNGMLDSIDEEYHELAKQAVIEY